jgi:hypothetical protein
MQSRRILFAAVAVAAMIPAPAVIAQLPPAVTPVAPGVEKGTTPKVIPGDNIAIACDAVENRAADSDVRVVLTISAVPGESNTGYAKVLATDEQLLKDAVRVRIPDVPSLQDHTVGVDVYVVTTASANAGHCDGGHVKIS